MFFYSWRKHRGQCLKDDFPSLFWLSYGGNMKMVKYEMKLLLIDVAEEVRPTDLILHPFGNFCLCFKFVGVVIHDIWGSCYWSEGFYDAVFLSLFFYFYECCGTCSNERRFIVELMKFCSVIKKKFITFKLTIWCILVYRIEQLTIIQCTTTRKLFFND